MDLSRPVLLLLQATGRRSCTAVQDGDNLVYESDSSGSGSANVELQNAVWDQRARKPTHMGSSFWVRPGGLHRVAFLGAYEGRHEGEKTAHNLTRPQVEEFMCCSGTND